MKKKVRTMKALALAVLALVMAGCDILSTHSHTYSTEWSYDTVQHWHECTGDDGAKTDEAAHTPGDWVIDTPATETAAGSRHKECTVCGYVTETETIPATGKNNDETVLKISASQVYKTEQRPHESPVITGPINDTKPLDYFLWNVTSLVDRTDISSCFTGTAALTNGKITVDLSPKENIQEEIFGSDIKGILITGFGDTGEYGVALAKPDENDVLTHVVLIVYVENDATFTGISGNSSNINGVSVKKGWNYLSVEMKRPYTCTRITDLSGYKWVNVYGTTDNIVLGIPESQVYEYRFNTGIVAGPIGNVTNQLDYFSWNIEDNTDKIDISSYFSDTSSVALTNGKIAVKLTPIESALENFNDRYKEDENICGSDVRGLIIAGFGDGNEYWPALAGLNEDNAVTHIVLFVYVDRGVTFTGNTAISWSGRSLNKGWNYLAVNIDSYTFAKITDLSGYKWVNVYNSQQ